MSRAGKIIQEKVKAEFLERGFMGTSVRRQGTGGRTFCISSHDVVAAFDAVIVEEINLQHMSQSLNFGKSVYDNGYGMLREMLAYKLNAQGKILVKVDRFFPLSKRCSVCHEVNHDLKLSDREWTCQSCGTHHDREKNSCKNLLDEGKGILCRWASGENSLILAPSGVLSEKKLHPQAHCNVRQGGE